MPSRPLLYAICAAAVTCAFSAPAHAATVTIPAAADTYSSSANPNLTHGSLSYMKSQASPRRVSYLRFNVPQLSGSVTKATLSVRASGASSTGVSARVVANNTWTESGLTYNNAPGLGAELSHSAGFASGSWVPLDVTSVVVSQGPVSVGISTATGDKKTFATRESSSPPRLVIETSESAPSGGVPPSTDPPPPASTDPATPLTVPAPPAVAGSLFSAASYHNLVLADDAPLDPNSAAAVNDLLGMVASYAEAINTSSWTTRVYTVPLTQPTVRVVNDNSGHPELGEAYSAVPLPSGAQPDAQADHHLTVWQPSSDTLWEFWGFYYDSSGVPHAKYGGRMVSVSTNPGHFVNATLPLFESKGWGATATSIPLLAGLIRYSEAQALNIPHAIAMAAPKNNCQFRNPAQRTDGGCVAGVQNLPPGARLRLPASLNVDALSCSPLCKAIARAVQRYGFVIRDRAGAIALYGENTGADWNTTIPGGKSLNGFPWDKLQMLPPAID